MSRTLLLTTGTSIANGTAALPGYQKRPTSWDDDSEDLRLQIRERLKTFDLQTGPARVRASAELNILHRLPANSGDTVVLFATDTADGRCCAEELARVIQKDFGIGEVVIERVNGLQVRDADILRQTGLTNLSRRLIHYLDDPQRRYGGGCVLCPNGGFKGVVPFMTVLGMIFRAPVVYVFEFAEAVISLPPLPIGFATDLFERALTALDWAAEEGIFDPEAFYRLIPGFDRGEEELFQSFLEISPDSERGVLASLSPLAVVLVEREKLSGGVLRISTGAAKELEALNGPDRRDVELHLRKLTSTLWRSQHRDTKHKNDLDFYPRGHNPWRFAGFMDQGVFHLCWFARHDEYERMIALPSSQRSAYAGVKFNEFIPEIRASAPDIQCPDEDQNLTWRELREQRNQAREELESLQASKAELLHRVLDLRKENEKAQQTIANLRESASNRFNRAPDSKPRIPRPVPDLCGQKLRVRIIEVRERSVLSDAVDHPGAKSIIVPSHDLRESVAGELLSVEVMGFDGTYFQARLLGPEETSAAK